MGKGWTYIILEGYCGEDWYCAKDKFHYKMDGTKVSNFCYNPDFKPEPPPEKCPGSVNSDCIGLKCPHFCYADVTKEFIDAVHARDKEFCDEDECEEENGYTKA